MRNLERLASLSDDSFGKFLLGIATFVGLVIPFSLIVSAGVSESFALSCMVIVFLPFCLGFLKLRQQHQEKRLAEREFPQTSAAEEMVSGTKAGTQVVVIPVLNHEGIIGETVSRLRDRFDTVIVVDGGSRDRTAEEAGIAGGSVICTGLPLDFQSAVVLGIRAALVRGASAVAVLAEVANWPAAMAVADAWEQSNVDIIVGKVVNRRPSKMVSLLSSRVVGLPEIVLARPGPILFSSRLARRLPRLRTKYSVVEEIILNAIRFGFTAKHVRVISSSMHPISRLQLLQELIQYVLGLLQLKVNLLGW